MAAERDEAGNATIVGKLRGPRQEGPKCRNVRSMSDFRMDIYKYISCIYIYTYVYAYVDTCSTHWQLYLWLWIDTFYCILE